MASFLANVSKERLLYYAAFGAFACSAAYSANLWKIKRNIRQYSCYSEACATFAEHPASAKYLGLPLKFYPPDVNLTPQAGSKLSATYSEVYFQVKGPENEGIVYAIGERPSKEDKWSLKTVVLELSPEDMKKEFSYVTIVSPAKLQAEETASTPVASKT